MKNRYPLSGVIGLVAAVCLALPGGAQTAPDCDGGEVYDDGVPNAVFGGFYSGPDGQSTVVSRFTPTSYPFAYTQSCLYLQYAFNDPVTFEVVVYDDNDAGGFLPGTLLAAVPQTIDPQVGWVSVDLGCISVSDGSVWIGLRWPRPTHTSGLSLGVDLNGTHGYAWSTDGGPWSAADGSSLGSLMIRADGVPNVTASATFRNGSFVNSPCYTTNPPVLGSLWTSRVNHGIYTSTSFTQIHVRLRPSPGLPFLGGELLLDPTSPRVFVSTVFSITTSDLHEVPLPDDPSLIGISVSSQGVVFGPNGITLCNAYDLVPGC